MVAEQEQEVPAWGVWPACIFWCVVLAGLTTLIVLAATSKHPVYSVTITGVAGLDDTSVAGNLPLSPVFNVTVRIDNGDKFEKACIYRLSTVSVSYGDAVLAGRGSLPQFCAKQRKVQERDARAWGKDVDLPQFLRDQLAGELAAGEAAMEVKVTTPARSYKGIDTVYVCSRNHEHRRIS